ncbi:MAG: DeoR/GlpR family DNA-binding transcription regulator [Oscillospiraceae bacterium]|nr:DeoR/GlpR family DNA-binding transcription regulator [Oscillospiraceae bacterium]
MRKYGGNVLALERRELIKTKLSSDGNVVVAELAREFGVTEETIRRDLDKLEQEGHARKTYGGAVRSDSAQFDLPYRIRSQTNVESKRQMATLAAKLVPDGATIAVDSSSSAAFVVRALQQKLSLSIITNSIGMLTELAGKTGWNILSTGGSLKGNGLALVGRQAERMVEGYHVEIAILSCRGLDASMGFMDSNEPDAEIKRAFIRQADKTIFLVDSSKFDRRSFVTIAETERASVIVTNAKPSDEWFQKLLDCGVEVIF